MLELRMLIDGKDKAYAGDMVYILRAIYHERNREEFANNLFGGK